MEAVTSLPQPQPVHTLLMEAELAAGHFGSSGLGLRDRSQWTLTPNFKNLQMTVKRVTKRELDLRLSDTEHGIRVPSMSMK